MKKLKLNVNREVLVILTPKGRSVLYNFRRKEARETRLPIKMVADENDKMFTKFQVWELMEIFGPHMGVGFSPCFELDIIVLFPDDFEVGNE